MSNPDHDNWWTKHWATVALIAFLLATAVGAFLVGLQARKHEDFWSIAVPGISTGAGTLALAAVTVWLARHQERRDQDTRRNEASAQTREQQERRDDEALREARKVLGEWTRTKSGAEKIRITNAGRDSILAVFLHTATAAPPDMPGHIWEWSPNDLDGLAFRGKERAWYRPCITPGHAERFEGSMAHVTGVKISDGRVDFYKQHIHVDIAWTDAYGNHWLRRDLEEPCPSTTPYTPQRPLGLEDADDNAAISTALTQTAEGRNAVGT